MPLKRPVTVAQARRWPASAKRRESFCARMGGMRERLTSLEVAADPASAINRSLAAWDCDDPEGLRPEHVSKGIRMKVTMSKVGSETRGRAKAARRNPADPAPYTVTWKSSVTRRINSSSSRTKADAVREARALAREGEKDISVSLYSPETGAVEIEWREAPPKAAARNPAPAKRTKTRRIVRIDPKTGKAIGTEFVPIDFDFRSYVGGIQFDFFARTEGAQLIISERTTGAKVGEVPYTTRAAALNDREAAKQYLSGLIDRIGADKFKAAVAKAPKLA